MTLNALLAELVAVVQLYRALGDGWKATPVAEVTGATGGGP
jgi:outer membrane protein TolC